MYYSIFFSHISVCNPTFGLILNLIASWFQINAKLYITSTSRVAGVDMGFIDDLSRDVEIPLRQSVLSVLIGDNVSLHKLLSLCYTLSIVPFDDNLNLFFHIHEEL